jgi:aspartyl-tRNA(Asn)/glutamyl-tRNA(Gln) amidotransferase subunit B
VIAKVLAQSPDEVSNFRSGKEGLFGWFMGQVMRETRGKADPKLTRELLLKALKGE